MKKLLILLALLFTAPSYADGPINPIVNFRSSDGTVSVYPYRVNVTNGALSATNSVATISVLSVAASADHQHPNYTPLSDFSTHQHNVSYADIDHQHSAYSTSTQLGDVADLLGTHQHNVSYPSASNFQQLYSIATTNTHSNYTPLSDFTTHQHNASYPGTAQFQQLYSIATTNQHDTYYADIDHQHSGYQAAGSFADSSHIHPNYTARIDNTHPEYTPLSLYSVHTHSNYQVAGSFADATHNHSNYTPLSDFTTHQHNANYATVAQNQAVAAIATTNTHAVATAAAAGFVLAIPSDATQYWDGSGAYSVPTGEGHLHPFYTPLSDYGTHAHTNYVPYTGATSTVNLGSQHLTTRALEVSSTSYLGGDVGVGIATASRRLHVRGIVNDSETNVQGVRITHGKEGSNWDLLIGGSANSFAGGLAIADEGTAKVVVSSSGNVGINITSPAHRLDVSGNVNATNLYGKYDNTHATVNTTHVGFTPILPNVATQFLNGAGAWTVPAGGSPSGADTQVQFNDSNAFGGDAGLTYDKTNDALTITGSSASTTPVNGLNIVNTNTTNNNGSWLRFSITRPTPGEVVAGAIGGTLDTDINMGELAFYSRNTGALYERMRLDRNGNLGINTTTPNSDYRLHVNGDLLCQTLVSTHQHANYSTSSGVDSFETLASPQALQGIEQLRHAVISYQNYGNVIVDGLQDLTGIAGVHQLTYAGSPDYQYAISSGTYDLVAQDAGTRIGDMTNGGGLVAAFDGNITGTYDLAVAYKNPHAGGGFVGKDWGAGVTRTIAQFKTWGSSNLGYDSTNGTGTNINLYLYGSNSSPANPTDGTLLYTAAQFGDANNVGAQTYNTGIETGTAYRYHWVTYVTTAGAGESIICLEEEFYTSDAIVSGFIHSLSYPFPTVPTHLGVSVKLDSAFPANNQHTYLKVDISRDGGTTFTDCHPVTQIGTAGYYRADQETITSQPSGSNVLAKITLAGSTARALRGYGIYGE